MVELRKERTPDDSRHEQDVTDNSEDTADEGRDIELKIDLARVEICAPLNLGP
jgi:hypothetical protein